MKKILILWILSLVVAQAQIRIGVINEDTTTRPLPYFGALAWKNNNLYVVKSAGATSKVLLNDKIFLTDNNKVGIGTKTPSEQFEVAGNAKIYGSLQIGVGAGVLFSNANGLLLSRNLVANDIPYLGGQYLDLAGGGSVNGSIDITDGDLKLNSMEDAFGEKTRFRLQNTGIGSTDSYLEIYRDKYFSWSGGWVPGGSLFTLKNAYLGLGGQTNPQATLDLGTSGTFRFGNAAGTDKFLRSTNDNGDAAWTTISKATVGLDNVDNTSDINKPISTATQTALSNKMDLYPIEVSLDGQEDGFGEKTRLRLQNTGLGSTDSYLQIFRDRYLSFSGWTPGAAIFTLKNGFLGLGAQTNPQANLDLGTSGTFRFGTAAGTDKFLRSTNDNGDAAWATISKATVGLENVDNTSDINKPVSSATQAALNTKMPYSGGVLYGNTSIRKKTAFNSSDTLFVIGGLGSDIGAVGQGDRLEFKQVSITGVPRWDISNFNSNTYQTNLTFLGQNIGIKRTNPSYNLDINGTFRAVGNSIFDGNVGIGTTTPAKKLEIVNAGESSIRLNNTNTNFWDIINTASSGNLEFNRGGSAFMTINAAGNLNTRTILPIVTNSSDIGSSGQIFNTIYVRGINAGANQLPFSNSTGEAMRIVGANIGIGTTTPLAKLEVGGSAAQTGAFIASRNTGNSFEFGHPNQAGYSSVLGANFGNGNPFIAFNTEAGTTSNTYRTRGFAGRLITNDVTNTKLLFQRVTNANADNQSAVTDLTIDGNGNVGVGTFSPTERLDILGENETSVKVASSNNNSWRGLKIGNAGATYSSILQRLDTGEMKIEAGLTGWGGFQTFYTSGLERVRVNQIGYVGIGVTNPSQRLHVDGYGKFNSGVVGNGGLLMLGDETSSNGFLLQQNGNMGIGTTSPAYKLDVFGIANASESIVSNSNAYLTLNATAAGTDLKRWRLQSQSDGVFAISRINDAQTVETNYVKILNNGNLLVNSNVGIGTTSTNAPLQLSNSLQNRKIVLYEGNNTDHEFYGFGINSGTLRYQVGILGANHVFFAGVDGVSSRQLFSINGDETVTYKPLTTSQINALAKVKGKMAYNSDTDKPVWCNGTVWRYSDGTNM